MTVEKMMVNYCSVEVKVVVNKLSLKVNYKIFYKEQA